MKTALKICAATVLLSACAAGEQTETPTVQSDMVRLSLTERVQAAVTETQKIATQALPEEIAGFKSAEPVADREKNQRGAGFVRVYVNDDMMATVFVYNNQNFGVSEEVSPALEVLMDKHLQEIQAHQDAGLYANVKIGTKKQRDFRWKGVKYQVLEADVQFSQKEETKKSFLVLGANKELMSYVRIRYTYPKSKQSELNKKQLVFTRTVMTALQDFAAKQKTPEAQ